MIVTVVSDRYLKSAYCMYELFQTYRNCADDPDKFLNGRSALILPDATLHPVTDRLDYAIYSKKQKQDLEAKIETLGIEYLDTATLASYRYIREFSNKVAEILHLVNDKMMPRDFDAMTANRFAEIVSLFDEGAPT